VATAISACGHLRPPGVYELRVTLVQEGVAWFDDLDPTNAWEATVVVV
jgi:hypothetical protein